jgi:hypothetical protein
MEPIDIILIVILAIALIGIIAYLIWQKKEGKGGCGCGCNGCPSAGACHRATPQTQEKTPDDKADEKEQGSA